MLGRKGICYDLVCGGGGFSGLRVCGRAKGVIMKEFFNTTKLGNEALAKAKGKALSQQEKVLFFFQNNPDRGFGVETIHLQVLPKSPYTSAQRCVSNLTDAGHLIKTTDFVKSHYGAKVHTWRLAPRPKEQLRLV